MAACGALSTLAVTEEGVLWAWGAGDDAQLGISTREPRVMPTRVGGGEVFGGAGVVMAAAGECHAAATTEEGHLWTWGDGEHGQLGQGDVEPRQAPSRVIVGVGADGSVLGWGRVVMVACGNLHTLVLTADGKVWSCGCGSWGRLGLGDTRDRHTPTLVRPNELFGGATIVMVAAGASHSASVSSEGDVWCWGCGREGCLGANVEDSLVPRQVGRDKLPAAVVMVAAGRAHTLSVADDGGLWAWGCGGYAFLAADMLY